jgi:integrase
MGPSDWKMSVMLMMAAGHGPAPPSLNTSRRWSLPSAAGFQFDRQHAVLKSTLAGVNRVKARTETQRKATALLGTDLHTLLQSLRAGLAADARDGALLSLGWSGALRRSEIVGLDWQQVGEGGGFVRITVRGVEITLMRSKASQDTAITIAIPSTDMPSAQFWLERWAEVAQLEPGQPVFRAVDRRQRISRKRLGDGSVSEIVKARIRTCAPQG